MIAEENEDLIVEPVEPVKKGSKAKSKPSDNGHGNNEMLKLLQQIVAKQTELTDRMDDYDEQAIKKDSTNSDALIRMVNFLYNTDDAHLPELTRIPVQSARPLSYGMMLEALHDVKVQSGEIPLSSILRNSYFRLMRSVGGIHLAMGVRLAEDQAAAAEEEKVDEMGLGDT